MTEVKQDIPPCVDCKHYKITEANGGYAFYYCGNSYAIDVVTGEKVYRYCITERHGKRCNFEPSFCYKIKKLFSRRVSK